MCKIVAVVVAKLSNCLARMNAKPPQLFRPLRAPLSASQIRTTKKDAKPSNLTTLPQIDSSTSTKTASQITSKQTSPLASNSSSSLSSATSIGKRKKVDRLADQLRRCTIQSPTRNLSYRTGSEAVSVEGIAGLIRNGLTKRIVVMTGAGISTPSGIPDFRTPGTGLYDNLKQYNILYPEAIFDLSYFHRNPRPFFTLAKELYPNGKYRPNYVHYFLRALHDKGLLLRLYTQNIDGLERSSGIPPSKLVEAHGTFVTASCTSCQAPSPSEDVRAAIFSDKIPRCKNPKCRGVVKPDIVFFEEQLPDRFYMYNKDFHDADLLLVLGTSLEVRPFADIVDSVRSNVPRLLFNRELVGPFHPKLKRRTDVASTGDIIVEVKKFVDLLGWTQDLDKLISDSQQPKQIVDDGKLDASPTIQSAEINSTKTADGNTRNSKETDSKQLQTALKTEKQKNAPERNAVEKNRKNNANPVSSSGNKSGNNHSRSISTLATVSGNNHSRSISSLATVYNKRLIPFHAQKELYRSSKVTPNSDTDDSNFSSSDDG